MGATPPDSISQYPAFDSVTAKGEENLRARKAAAAEVANRTVGVYDKRDGSVVQVPVGEAKEFADVGYTVGDAESERKQLANSSLAQADVFAHHIANAATFNTYDNIAALLGHKDYLENEKELDAENPKSAFAGDLVGGAASAPLRDASPIGFALSAYEGGTAAATNAYALDEPITAERVIQGAGAGLLYNAAFNAGGTILAKGAKKLGTGLHAFNDKFKIFVKEGEEAAESGRARYRSNPVDNGTPRRPVESNTPTDTSAATKPQSAAEKMGRAITRDSETIAREFHENQAAQNAALIELDGLDHESTRAQQLVKQLAKHEEIEARLVEEMGLKPRGTGHIPPKDAPNQEGTFEYPGATKTSQKVNMWRKSYEDLLGTDENHLLDAARKDAGARGAAHVKNGDMVEAEKAFEQKATIERQLHKALPDTVHPETGDVVPGFRKHIEEYSRLMGNDTSGLGSLKFRPATSAEKAAIDAEVSAHPDSAAQFRGDTPSQKPHIGEGEPHVPEPAATAAPRKTLRSVKDAWTDSMNRITELKNKAVMLDGKGTPEQIAELEAQYAEATAVHKANAKEKGLWEKNAKRINHVKEQLSQAKFYQSNKHFGLYTPEELTARIEKYSAELTELEKFGKPEVKPPPKPVESPAGADEVTRKRLQDYARKIADRKVGEPPIVEREKPLASGPTAPPEAPPENPGDVSTPPGEVNKVSDITGKTPAEQSAGNVGRRGPKYVPRWRRSTFWKLHWATPTMLKPLVHGAAAFNEIGPFVLNNSTRFAEGLQSIADASSRGTAGAIKRAISGTMGRRAAMGDTDPKKEFDKNIAMITAGQASPGTLEQGVKAILGPEADDHPELTGNVVAGLGRQVNALSNEMPRNVQLPTARNNTYTPPRSVMVRFNRTVRAVTDPDTVIANPDPDTWAAVQAAHPETAKYVQDLLMDVVANPNIKLNKQQARNVSILLGQPITPQNQADYLKSLQDTATLMNVSDPPGKPGGGPSSGPKSAKTGQQVLSLDATPEQQAQLGM